MEKARHPRGARHRFPAEAISYAIWLYFRVPLSLRMVEAMLLARGILISQESDRQWPLKFGPGFANQIRRRLPAPSHKWRLVWSHRGTFPRPYRKNSATISSPLASVEILTFAGRRARLR
jgi:hypothetical protein